jgi:hypothetical protein
MLGEGHSNSMRLMAGSAAENKGMCSVQRKNSLLRKRSLTRAQIRTNTACRKLNTVTETTNIGGSNGTNLKPIAPILFYTFFKNRGVLVLRPDSWGKRPRRTSTPGGQLA